MLFEAQKLHAFLIKSGLQNDVFRCNLLLQAYTQCSALSDANILLAQMPTANAVSYNTLLSAHIRSAHINTALNLFSSAPEPDTRSWNITLSGLARTRRFEEATAFFARMRSDASVRPDDYTYAIILPCCSLILGKQIHGQIIKVCSRIDPFIGTHLARMYAEMEGIGDAWKMFDEMPERDMVSWNALISCFSKNGLGKLGLQIFRQIVGEGMRMDEYTFATILNELASCSRVFEGMQLHSLILRCGYRFDLFTCNALVNLYWKCGFVGSADRLFDEMPERDVVSWTSMIVGLVQVGREKDAMWVFNQMMFAGVEPNSFTFGGLLSACANATAFGKGKQYHGLVLKFGLELDVVVGSAIVDMYSKCGAMDDASRFFQHMPEKDLVLWNAMICGFAQNGQSMRALKLFNEMIRLSGNSIIPNHITFIGVLSACAHGGLIRDGRQYFSDMIHKYLIEPTAEHYTLMVDILARAGLLEEAEDVILASPFEADNVMWGTLLSACRKHGTLDMARRVADRLFVDEPKNSSSYVLLANMYTVIGDWGDSSEVREVMNARGAQKMTGSSWIEIRNCVYSFVAGQKYHPHIELIYDALQQLCLQMMDEGYHHDYDSLIA